MSELELHKKMCPAQRRYEGKNGHYYDSPFVVRFNSQTRFLFAFIFPEILPSIQTAANTGNFIL